ncbi:MAG TPA: hypothetical protein VL025_19240, partial [Thermoanaerobaculia bacterium]|nr:hypothetical protein [Thermoanaerobaculia bacterium]
MLRIPFRRNETDWARLMPEADPSDLHRNERTYLAEALQDHFREAPDIFIASGLPLCYVERKPRAGVLVDVLVARGLP